MTEKNEPIHLSVLIVEDNPSDAELLVLRLKNAGFKLDWQRVETEQEYHKALNKSWELILADWRLPHFSGMRALQILNELELEVPFIIISGSIGEEAAVNAMQHGAHDYLLKDRPERLEQAVRNALEHKKLQETSRRMQRELQESEEKYRELVEHATDGIAILQDDEVKFANQRLLDMLGQTSKENVVNKPFLNQIFPEDQGLVTERYQQYRKGESNSSIEASLLHQNGNPISVEIDAERIIYQGKPADMVIIRDLRERQRLQQVTQARFRLTEFAFSHSLAELLQKTLDEIGQLTESPIGFYHFVETDEKTLMLQAWSTLTIDRFCKADGKGAHYGLDEAGVWADAIRQRKAVIHNDYASLPNRKGMPPGHAEVKRELVVPIFRDNKIKAVLGMGNKDSDYTTQDVELVTYFADIGWELAERKRLDELNRLQASALNAAANAIIITDRDGCIEWANSAFYHLTGYTEDETIGRNPRELVKSDKQDVAVYKNMWETICTGRVWRGEIINRRKSGSEYDEELTITPLLNNEGKVEKFIAIKQDISERKQAEEQLRFSEVRFRQMFNNMNSGVAVYEAVRNGEDFIFKDFNHAAEVIEKTSRGKVIGKSVVSCFPGVIEFGLLDVLKRVWHSGKSEYLAPKLYQDQRIVGWRENFVYKLANGEIVVIYEDVTEKMKAEEQLRYQALLLNQVNDAVIATDERSRMTFYNAAAEETFGWKPEEALGRVSQELMKTEYVGISREEAMQMLIKTGHWRGETTRLRKDGTRIPVEVSNTVVKDEKGKMVGIIGVNRDISERKKLEEILRTNEQSLKEAQKLGRIGNWEFDITNNALTWSDETFELYERDPAQGTPSPDEEGEYYSPEQSKQLREYARQAIETGKGFSYDLEVNLPSGKKAFFAASMRSIKDEKGGVVKLFGTVQDITERKKAEEEIQKRVKQLTTARQIGGSLVETLELEQIYERLYEAAIALLPGSETMFISLYDSTKRKFHCEFAMSMGERMDASKLPPAPLEPPGIGTQSEVVYSRQPLIVENLPERLKKVSMVVNVGDEDEKAQSGLYVPMLTKDEVIGVVIMQSRKKNLYTQDDAKMLSLVANTAAIAIQNARLYEQTEKRLQQISALHLIDNAISGSFELDLVFNILMDTLVSQLEVHAGNILQLRTETQELEYLSQRGFRKPPFLHSKIPTSLHLSGMVLHERKPVIVPDLQSEFENFVRAEEIEKEGFKAYVGVPLVAKGELLGILEVFQREIIHPSKNWMDYLETIAGQAAIAIDNHRLFGQLQQSNMELKQAYDATITGWSSALDLRDQETEGHSQRVTEMTLQLARQLGIPERELTDIRYGALLHDIGKIGVSDVVLKKPGPLNEIEWASMRMHPQLAQELLAPVAYLRKSLEIPYCHHEKWDGSGYPRSLKGEQIPLAARIFAVVDVWDALISDRPYRKAWPRQKALEYIKEQRGKHFDPKIVDAFINMGIYNKKSK